MKTNDKTLADVQPGGRVRLGDQAELDRLEFQAWARELLPCPFCGNGAEFVPYKDNGLTLKCKSMGCIKRNQRTLRYGIDWLRTSMAEHWNTRALSAQPSPGGQGDAVRALPAEWRERAEELSVHDAIGLTHQLKLKDCADELDAALASMPPSPAVGVTDAMVHAYSKAYDKNWEAQLRAPEDAPELGTFFAMRAGLQAALAARQPVGEPVGYFDPDVLAHLTEGLIDPVGVLRRKPNGTSNVPVWLGPPEQAVDADGFWLAVDEDGFVHFGQSIDDGNGGVGVRENVESRINDWLDNDGRSVDLVWAGSAPAPAVDLPYSLDADPAGIRAHVADVITGTLMVGAQGHTPPPAGHWAEPFWRAALADAALQVKMREALWAAARSLRTIADSTKETEFLETASEIRAYANSRANCAEQALTDSQAVGK